jgi:two-component system, chemotaxis family, CheB/CheR fusion protein
LTQAIGELDPAGLLAVLDLAQAMVRDLDGRITYWTSGMERLYGWPAQQAVGRISHELLATQFPRRRGEIEADLLRDGQWHGELRHTARDGRAIRVASHWALQRNGAGRPASAVEVNTEKLLLL